MSGVLLQPALAAYDAGLCPLPVREDGSKAPKVKWERYQSERPSREQVESWFSNGQTGIGTLCGGTAGNLEMLELEGRAVAEGLVKRFGSALTKAGLAELMKRISAGYSEDTPSGGIHLYYRCTDPIDGNQKLAFDENGQVLIETRAEGGFSVIAPSHGKVHDTGKPWVVRKGGYDTIVTITGEERTALLELCRSFDRRAAQEEPNRPTPTGETFLGDRVLVGDADHWMADVIADYNRTTTWETVLADVFEPVPKTTDRWHFNGAKHTVSATTNALGTDTLIVFSSTAAGKGWKVHEGGRTKAPSYDKFSAHVFITTGRDDRSARVVAARQLRPPTERSAQHGAPPPGVDPETGEVLRLHLPDEFYDARRVLAHIGQAARARQRSRDAVFHVVLARVAAAVPHFIKLPATVGSPSPLCYFVVTLAPPGFGKGDACAIGTELVPVDDYVADHLPIGSGEGLAEVLFDLVTEEDNGKPVKVKRLVRHNAFVNIDEGDALTQLGARNGSTLLSTTRSIWSGKVIGNTNAARENRRIVPAGAYTFGIVVGLQDTKAGPLLDEVDAGTPQRFGWAYAIDPNLPDSPPAWPGPLDWQPPDEKLLDTIYTSRPPDDGPTHPLDVHPDIKAEIRAVDLARAKGKGPRDPWAAHGALLRLRVAALLAVLDGRLHVHVEDWELAGTVKAISDNVRTHAQNAVAAEATQKERQTSTRLANRAAEADSAVRQRRIIHCAERIVDKVHAQPDGWTNSDLRRNLRSWREVFDDGLLHAKVEGWVIERTEPGQGTDKRMLVPGTQRARRVA